MPAPPNNPRREQPSDEFTIRDEANALVAWAFRNGPLEDLHAGKSSALLDDPSLSRITDDEMKMLMINACRQLSKLLELKEIDPAEYKRQIKSYHWRFCRNWERYAERHPTLFFPGQPLAAVVELRVVVQVHRLSAKTAEF